MNIFLHKENLPQLYIAVIRVWLGSLLVYNGLHLSEDDALSLLLKSESIKSVIGETDTVNYIAKMIDLISGTFIFLGLYTRAFSIFIALAMLIGTIASKSNLINLGNSNNAFTNIFFWFSSLVIFFGPGKKSLDYLFFGKEPGFKTQ